MEKANINNRRKALFNSTLDAVERDWSDLGEPAQRLADRLLLKAQDGTELLIHLASVKQGYGFKTGEFGVNFSLIACKGPIYDLMRMLGLLTGEESSDGRIFQTGSLSLSSDGGLYALRLSDDPARVAMRIAADLKKLAHPLAKRLVTRQADVLKLITETPDAFEKPFGTAAALLALNGNLPELEKFWAATDGNSSIWDRPAPGGLEALQAAASKALK